MMINPRLCFIPIGELVRAGIVPHGDDPWPDDARWRIEAPAWSAIVRCCEQHSVIVVDRHVLGTTVQHNLTLSARMLRYGRRWYWVCPWCARHCLDLILADDDFVCRACFRETVQFSKRRCEALLLAAEDAVKSGKFRIDRVQEAGDNVSQHGAADKPVVPPEPDITLDRARARRHDYGTEAAIRRGVGIAQHDLYEFYRSKSLEERDDLPLITGFERPSSVALLDAYPALDIRKLWSEAKDYPDNVTGLLLRWEEAPSTLYRPVFIDRRFAEPVIVLASDWEAREQRQWQRMPIQLHSSGRVRFRCPVTQKLCDMLYERGGVFASAVAQRLVHPSQRVAGRNKAKKRG